MASFEIHNFYLFVSRSVWLHSALQKIRLRDGSMAGVIHRSNGELYSAPYHKLLREVIDSNEADLLANFILTVALQEYEAAEAEAKTLASFQSKASLTA